MRNETETQNSQQTSPSPCGIRYFQASERWKLLRKSKPSMSVEASLYDAIRDAVKAGDQTLEFGSGLSTFGFSSPQTTHIAIESDSYQANLINMCFGCALYVPLDSNGWYKMPVDPIVQGKADVILVDGPSAAEGGDRLQGMENILSYAKENTIIFVDDVHRENEIQLARGLAHRLDRQIRYKDRWAKI